MTRNVLVALFIIVLLVVGPYLLFYSLPVLITFTANPLSYALLFLVIFLVILGVRAVWKRL